MIDAAKRYAAEGSAMHADYTSMARSGVLAVQCACQKKKKKKKQKKKQALRSKNDSHFFALSGKHMLPDMEGSTCWPIGIAAPLVL